MHVAESEGVAENLVEVDLFHFKTLTSSLEYQQAEIYLMNQQYDKAMPILDAIRQAMRTRNHKDQLCLQFNSFSYIFVLKQLYLCQISLAENELANVYRFSNMLKEARKDEDPT